MGTRYRRILLVERIDCSLYNLCHLFFGQNGQLTLIDDLTYELWLQLKLNKTTTQKQVGSSMTSLSGKATGGGMGSATCTVQVLVKDVANG